MTATASDWQILPLLTLIGSCLGMLGALYLAYDLFGRSKLLHKCTWVFSSGLLFAFILLSFFLLFFGPSRLIGPARFTSGYLPTATWRLIGISSGVGFVIQLAYFSPVPVCSPMVDRLRLVLSLALNTLELLGLGIFLAPQGSSPIMMIILALPGIIGMGLVNGFSSAIQWWVLHLPEKRVAAIGALLICCAFALIAVQPLLGFLSISLAT
jgi:hypothetical protein